jgi:hypothetical protein
MKRYGLHRKPAQDQQQILAAMLAFNAPPDGEPQPVPMILYCPQCHLQHVDEPDERTPEWDNPPHRSHLCHGCGCIWRPADVATEGVRSIKTAGKADTWGWDGASLALSPHQGDREAIAREALELALPILEAEYEQAKDAGDSDWEGQSFTAFDAVKRALLQAPPPTDEGVAGATPECPNSPNFRHQVDTSMESGPNNCFYCEKSMAPTPSEKGEKLP